MSELTGPSDYSAPSSATIQQRQNGLHALRLLIAQRRLYTGAKRWQGVRWVGLLVLGVGAPFVSLLAPTFAITAGAVTGVWLFAGRTILTWLETRSMVKAACVQEELDHYLFDMPQTITRAERPTPEEIDLLIRSDDVRGIADRERLTNWYPVDVESPGAVTIAIAQRANASYTDRLIRTTVAVWAAVTVVWVASLILWAGLTGIALSDFLLGALFPVLPAFLDVAEYVMNTWKAARDRADLATTIESRLAVASPSIDGQDLLVWQERLFDLRRTTPQVPNWLYRATRRRNEHAMIAAARQLRTDR
ncbi:MULTISPECIES: S-4TM family putative pore-forming effector [unclassified Curtobacterium]|uniref:S-4TM family putative pore-forming effector n=1 Tax=unclassified Curtobacterium TaxID=257496 RepID=UPI001E2C8F5A|nr:S-4TM family putative pore-forming effector [Curtobacterium sp. VKM Ac-2865]